MGYSPVFLLAITPLAMLPWTVFLVVWMVAEGLCFLWLTATMRLRWRVPLLLLCVQEVMTGNIYGFLGVMVVLGFKRPGLWAFAFLTKVTIGLSTTLEIEAITTGENEATQTDWMGDLYGGLGVDPAAGCGRGSAASDRS